MADTNVPIEGITVPALTDNAIWFANAAAWAAYWLQVGFTANIPVADVGDYGLVKKAVTALYTDPASTPTQRVTLQIDNDGDGVVEEYSFVLASSYDELRLQFDALNVAFKDMRTALKAAGIQTQAQ